MGKELNEYTIVTELKKNEKILQIPITNKMKMCHQELILVYRVKYCNLEKPIDSNVSKPGEQWELSQSNKEQEIMMFAGLISPHLSEKNSFHCFYQKYSHA